MLNHITTCIAHHRISDKGGSGSAYKSRASIAVINTRHRLVAAQSTQLSGASTSPGCARAACNWDQRSPLSPQMAAAPRLTAQRLLPAQAPPPATATAPVTSGTQRTQMRPVPAAALARAMPLMPASVLVPATPTAAAGTLPGRPPTTASAASRAPPAGPCRTLRRTTMPAAGELHGRAGLHTGQLQLAARLRFWATAARRPVLTARRPMLGRQGPARRPKANWGTPDSQARLFGRFRSVPLAIHARVISCAACKRTLKEDVSSANSLMTNIAVK